MTALSERFESFIQTLKGFENIDALLKGNDPKDKKRADYFLENRKIIIEQKVLRVNPKDKPQKFANRLMEERGILAYGTFSTRQLFANQPDKEALQRLLVLKIGEVIEDNIAHADKQTRDTRDIFKIPEALGILVILNEGAGMLSPDIIGYPHRRPWPHLCLCHRPGKISAFEAGCPGAWTARNEPQPNRSRHEHGLSIASGWIERAGRHRYFLDGHF